MTQQLLRFRIGTLTSKWGFPSSSNLNQTKNLWTSSRALVSDSNGKGCHSKCSCQSPCLLKAGPSFIHESRISSLIHTVSSSQGALSSEYRVPESIVPSHSKSVSAKLLGNRRWDVQRECPVQQKLVSAKTTEEILAVLEEEIETLDAISTSIAVDSLFDALKNGPQKSVRAKHQILTSVGAQKLCKLLRRLSPHMDPGDILNGVKLLSFLCAPGNHTTFQILLKLISKHANNLDLQQLAYTQFLLDKLHSDSKSSLSEALQFALPVVFESKLSTNADRNDPVALADYLHYATRYKISDKSINFLIDSLTKIMDRERDKISLRSAVSILWSLTDTEFNDPSHEALAAWCFRRLTESIGELKMIDLSTTVEKASRKYGPKALYFYNEDFVNAYCLRMLEKDVDSEMVLWSIKIVSQFRHVNIEHIDRIGEIISSNPSHILNQDKLYRIMVKSLANLNYKPEKWSMFSSLLLEHPALSKRFTIAEVSLALDFLSLDLFPESIIRVLFSAEGIPILEEYLNRYQASLQLVLLYNAVKNLHQQKYPGPWPPISMIEQWKEMSRAACAVKTYPLKTALQTGLGGESYVINGLYHEGLFIDHGIVMRKGGYPVALNSQSQSQSDSVSSIKKPAESVMILIKVCHRDIYANNTRRLRGGASLELKILESLGHPIVVVDLENWQELPDHEKIPFLMHRIREKMEHLQWNQNWGDVIPP